MKATLALAVATLLLCVAAARGREVGLTRSVHGHADKEAAEKVKFELYTREFPDEPEVLSVDDLPTPYVNFNPRRATKVVVHGWHGSTARAHLIKDAYLSTSDANVFIVNWHKVDTLVYPVAARHVKVVGKQLAAVIMHLVDKQGMDAADLHIVGHSLGAHIAGMSALHLREDVIIGRITGLDPAGPLFKDGRENRLDKSHAAFVDIIHTCANVFGYRDPIGHVDFYPNGGVGSQPGCLFLDLTTGKCSHNRAYDLYHESILTTEAFPASPAFPTSDTRHFCTEVDTDGEIAYMGLAASAGVHGIYCLDTRGESPYGFGTLDPTLLI